MRFVVSTGISSGLTPSDIVDVASECGFDAVELQVGANFQDEHARALVLTRGGIELAAVNFGARVDSLPRQLEFAAQLKASSVRIQIKNLLDRNGIITPRMVEQLCDAGSIAADFGILILIENDRFPGAMLRLWHVLDRLNHPCIACAWNVGNGLAAGDRPSVGVPTLNSRIRYVELNLEEATDASHATLNRLRGIGFDGFVQVNSSSAVYADRAQLEQSLVRAAGVLRGWQLMPDLRRAK